MKKLYVVFAAFVIALAASPAYAIKITNLDDVPHKLIVNNGGEESEITIAPGSNYFTYGPMVDVAPDRKTKPRRLQWDAEYAIWPDGKLYLQRIRGNYRD